MLEKQLTGNRYVLDINVMAIYLVENHPGNKYISTIIDNAISKNIELIIFDFLPFRVYWILTSKWKVQKQEAKEAIISFLKLPNLKLVPLNKQDILEAFKKAEAIKHDVYDITYIVLAKKTNATGIIATDTDFENLCKNENLQYINPVPKNILKKFSQYK